MGRKMVYVVLPLALLCGCLGPSAPEVKTWNVEPQRSAAAPVRSMEGAGQLFSATRFGSVVVDAPYDRAQLTVRRGDGTVAFDPYNVFAASPSSLLRASAQSGLDCDGRFGHIVSQSSVVSSDALVEVQVKDFSLDGREPGRRLACASVSVDVVKMGRGPRTVAYSGAGSATVDAQDGNYSRAFSQVFSKALDAAVNDALAPARK